MYTCVTPRTGVKERGWVDEGRGGAGDQLQCTPGAQAENMGLHRRGKTWPTVVASFSFSLRAATNEPSLEPAAGSIRLG